ncbi:hypothetical protein [Aquimarina agarivorans]|uniref:hypothetical protein n=1 Tax=Aquimarina agarivorans TaxID=980584 RepID=UPI000248ED76|nr:hypothetical protein [Aquimarina agarivorans]
MSRLWLFLEKTEKIKRFFDKKVGLYLAMFAIIASNLVIYSVSNTHKFSAEQSRRDASAFSIYFAKKFIYFYYHTGYFPLGTINTDLVYTDKGAAQEIEKRGSDLIMEFYHWSRLGENTRIFAFLPNAWLDGGVEKPSIRLFNTIVFIFSLLCLCWGFGEIKKLLFGLLLIFCINTTPFYLFEVFTRENIFGILPATFYIILGLNLPILFNKKTSLYYKLMVPILSAFFIGFFSEIRNEIAVVLLSLLLIYILTNNLGYKFKVLALVLVLFSFKSTKEYLRFYFKSKFAETTALVASKGGHVYHGSVIKGHMVWHPVFCGLGDFDTKYGYEWNDMVAFNYAMPILNNKYGLNLKYNGGYHLDQFYDDEKLYYVKFDEIPEYEPIVKAKVLADIINDPLWYADIIWKRIMRLLTRTLPYSYLGFLGIPLLFYLVEQKKWQWIKLLIISLPLSATSIVIYSDRGTTYNSVFGYFILLIIIHEMYTFFETNQL